MRIQQITILTKAKYLMNSNSGTMLIELIRLALPVIGSTFLSMAYNLINMFFIGRLGTEALAAIGSAGFYIHLGWAVSSIITIGVSIKVSHAVGKKNYLLSRSYVKSGWLAITLLAFICMLFLVTCRKYLIEILQIKNQCIEEAASFYLIPAGISLFFSYQNYYLSAIFIGAGNSNKPFYNNVIGIIINILLDIFFIFVLHKGVIGAGIASLISQIIVTILNISQLKKSKLLNPGKVIFRRILLKEILKLGLSPTLQRIAFSMIAIAIAKIVCEWGPTAIAVQKIGVQIESLSFLTASGFSTALSTISGQAFSTSDYKKQWEVFKAGIFMALGIGLISTFIFLFFPETLISIFIKDLDSIRMGRDYMVILGFSQVFSCLEMMVTGAFYGWGKTMIPAIISIALTAFRIPMCIILTDILQTGLNGVWWSITISSMLKGILVLVLYLIMFKRFIKIK